MLAHVFRPEDGASLAASLIGDGLAWQIAIPPNLGYVDCNRQAEERARREGRGLWSGQYLGSSQATRLQGGFRVLNARIERIGFSKSSWWLETDGGFVARIPTDDQVWFDRAGVRDWEGRKVEVRGWMYRRNAGRSGQSPWVLLLQHPSALRTLDD
jgi:hypothetical protein